MVAVGAALKRTARAFWTLVCEHKASAAGLAIALVGTIAGLAALPQVQSLFKSDRELLRDMGYGWNSEGLDQAIRAEDVKAVQAFVHSNIRIPESTVRLVLRGSTPPVASSSPGRPFARDVVAALARARTIDPAACEQILSDGAIAGQTWPDWVTQDAGYRQFFAAICDMSGARYKRARRALQARYDEQAAEMADLLALGQCRPTPQGSYACVYFYANLPAGLREARSKLETVHRLECALASDRAACARGQTRGWQLPPPDPARLARTRGVFDECVADLKQRYSCVAFLEYASSAPSLLLPGDEAHATLDQPIDLAVAVAQARLASGQATGANICQIYEEAIQRGCHQAAMAALADGSAPGH